jgi:hypothetical protein
VDYCGEKDVLPLATKISNSASELVGQVQCSSPQETIDTMRPTHYCREIIGVRDILLLQLTEGIDLRQESPDDEDQRPRRGGVAISVSFALMSFATPMMRNSSGSLPEFLISLASFNCTGITSPE